ncbi:MAG: hypothetical protein WCX71_05775 [Candidatus Buchananbacteria bacterium]
MDPLMPTAGIILLMAALVFLFTISPEEKPVSRVSPPTGNRLPPKTRLDSTSIIPLGEVDFDGGEEI